MRRFLIVLLCSVFHIGLIAFLASHLDEYVRIAVAVGNLTGNWMPMVTSVIIVSSLLLMQCFNIWFFLKYIRLIEDKPAELV